MKIIILILCNYKKVPHKKKINENLCKFPHALSEALECVFMSIIFFESDFMLKVDARNSREVPLM